jgi:hypothetical protein
MTCYYKHVALISFKVQQQIILHSDVLHSGSTCSINCVAKGNSQKETQETGTLPALVDDAFPAYDVVSPVPPFYAKDSVFPQVLHLC